ncbi:zinc finger protein [Vairimorpha ceranae]|uniref:Zinc finger protein n=1 Tax=Vairimorpha ceranae TaxID=40302 RepID=A0A0F9WBG0_9MICR|nr:zinc finger protein [Vairimorpha ceranae]KKO74856.1 zinc finger protein [Vairimorpha ceranae]
MRQKTTQKYKKRCKRRIVVNRLKKEGVLGLDQIQNNIKNNIKPENLDEVPSNGKFYCMECDRFFISENSLASHLKTKVHKKRIKELKDVIHTQRHAEMAAGLFN